MQFLRYWTTSTYYSITLQYYQDQSATPAPVCLLPLPMRYRIAWKGIEGDKAPRCPDTSYCSSIDGEPRISSTRCSLSACRFRACMVPIIRLNGLDTDILVVLVVAEVLPPLLVNMEVTTATELFSSGLPTAVGGWLHCCHSLLPITSGPNKQHMRRTNDIHTLINCMNRLNFSEDDWDAPLFRDVFPRRDGFERNVIPTCAVGIGGLSCATDEDGFTSTDS